MGNSIVGLDIGASGIRAAEVTRTRKGTKLLRYHSLPLPGGVLQRGEVVEPQILTSALKALWKQGRFSTNRVVLGIGNDRVIARELTVPSAPLPLIRESLPFQVQDVLPVPVADAILDFYPVAEAEHGQVQGLLVAAVKEGVLATIEAVHKAKLEAVTVDFIPFALSRALLPPVPADEAIAVVDVGAHTTTVVIVHAGVPQFVRIIPTGGDEVTHTLHARLDIERAVAEDAKRSLGLGVHEIAPHDQPAVDTIREVTGELVTGVRNTVTYFAASRPELPVRRAVLTGDGASLGGFPGALAEVLRMPVDAGNAFAPLAVRERDRARTAADAHRAVVAVGLAMRSAA
ncbi:type IV pilus assembly protein PilM [Agrococcus baldri]|uniref:Pilus assembly protein PilM n=1 Tax=Agrococcus baldri TaxID=153730 RepID=A0AA87RIP2_9MICO|nr:type IV pilus assembly protein PilM [Agrococcus baldri]GEK80996.1 pilus assembly protein PilM [Agrococcus baldri]